MSLGKGDHESRFIFDVDKCKNCVLKRNEFSNAYYLKEKFNKFVENQKDIPSEFVDIVNKEFWSLI
jgi:hypothetical protein